MTNIVPMDSFSLLTVLWIRRKTFNINHPRPLNLYVKLAPFHLCFYWGKKIKVPSPFFNNGYFQRPSKVSFPLSCLKGLLSPEELRLLPLETWLIQGNINSVSLFLSLSSELNFKWNMWDESWERGYVGCHTPLCLRHQLCSEQIKCQSGKSVRKANQLREDLFALLEDDIIQKVVPFSFDFW